MTRWLHRTHCLVVIAAVLLCGPAGYARAQPAPLAAPATTAAKQPQTSGVWYEIFVRSWQDTDNDGIGDLNGVTAKLDYLQSLGISGIWLMPINPSPSYHGYDVTDYRAINPQYGSMRDFEHLLAEAHRRGIAVMMDLVINHTSNHHPWFNSALDPHSPYRNWYVWAQPGTDLQAPSAAGASAWHAAGAGHYLGVFSTDMPDLDYDNPAVRREMIDIARFWLDKGVDGFRLDAARHIYDNLPSDDGDPAVLRRNLAWWSTFRKAIAAGHPDAWLLGEVTVHSADELAANELAPWLRSLDAVFDFPLATRLIESAKTEHSLHLGAELARARKAYRASAGDRFIDATFLSNHDQDRTASQLDGDPQRMRMAAAMLLTLPGRPFVYYGEELGMRGHKPDPDIREPMRWNRAADAPGETTWKTSTAGQGPEVSVEAQQDDPQSLLAFYAMLIHWRVQVSALRDGTIRDHPLGNDGIDAWELEDAHGRVLVVHNLSAQPQQIVVGGAAAGAAVHRFDALLLHSKPGVVLRQGRLTMPAHSTAILH